MAIRWLTALAAGFGLRIFAASIGYARGRWSRPWATVGIASASELLLWFVVVDA